MTETRYPYDVLKLFAIHTRSSSREVQDVFPTTREEREAWDVLRYPRYRLKADFFLYQIQDEDRLFEFQEWMRSKVTAPRVAEVCDRLHEDAPIMLLLLGYRQEARRIWEELQQQHPSDIRIAHRLALLAYAEAQHCETDGHYGGATEAWYLVIANWVCTLSNDKYWQAWCQKRQWGYGSNALQPEVWETVREDLYQHLAAEFAAYADHYWRAENRERAQVHRALELLYAVERQGAQALKAAGGLEIPAGGTIACGPLLLRQLHLELPYSQLISTLQENLKGREVSDFVEALQQLVEVLQQKETEPKVSREVVQSLRVYFSELAPVAAYLNLNKPDMAVAALPALRRELTEFDKRNPSYSHLHDKVQTFRRDAADLAIQAHIAIAHHHITAAPPDWSASKAAWQEVLRQGRAAGLEKKAVKAISDQAIGRVHGLQNASGHDEGVLLDEAVALLDAAYVILLSADASPIIPFLADTLHERGSWRSDQDDDAGAVEDLRRAFQLTPGDVAIRDRFCTALIHYAHVHTRAGNKQEAVGLLEQAIKVVQAGLREHPDNAPLLETLQWAQNELDLLLGKDPRERTWAEWERATGSTQPAGGNQQTLMEWIRKAERKRERKDYAGAIADLEQALVTDASSAWAKAEIAQTYSMWAKRLLEHGSLEEAEEKCSLGLPYRVDDPMLLEVQKDIEVTKQILGD
jgi:tetratricopeptide (TPR) repeat protein